MGFLDESLRSLSEALRFSQNNADDESINHCIIYLYQISSLLGYNKDTLNLAEHAISHSLNLNNPLLMLYSTIAYANFERIFDP